MAQGHPGSQQGASSRHAGTADKQGAHSLSQHLVVPQLVVHESRDTNIQVPLETLDWYFHALAVQAFLQIDGQRWSTDLGIQVPTDLAGKRIQGVRKSRVFNATLPDTGGRRKTTAGRRKYPAFCLQDEGVEHTPASPWHGLPSHHPPPAAPWAAAHRPCLHTAPVARARSCAISWSTGAPLATGACGSRCEWTTRVRGATIAKQPRYQGMRSSHGNLHTQRRFHLHSAK